jgi:hypothetical protein
MILQLKSVGSVIDTETKIVYAKYETGGYDKDSGKHLDDCSKHLIDLMSEDDIILINENCNDEK